MHLFSEEIVFFFSLNYRKIECEVILYNSTKHFVNSIWKCLCHMCLFLVHVSWVLNLLFVSNRKWQEATQQIQTLQASQSLLAEYEQKIKVRHWVCMNLVLIFLKNFFSVRAEVFWMNALFDLEPSALVF